MTQCPSCYYPNDATAWRCDRCGQRLHSATTLAVLGLAVVTLAATVAVAMSLP